MFLFLCFTIFHKFAEVSDDCHMENIHKTCQLNFISKSKLKKLGTLASREIALPAEEPPDALAGAEAGQHGHLGEDVDARVGKDCGG